MRPRTRHSAAAALVLTGCLVAGCGGESDPTSTADSTVSISSGAVVESTSGSSGASSTGGPDESAPQSLSPVTVTAYPEEAEQVSGETVADGLDVPWGIAFLPDGDALVSERDTAQLLRITPEGSVSTVATVGGVVPTSEGGLLGVAVSPNYADDETVYAYASTASDNRVLAGTLDDFAAGAERPILTDIPVGQIHNGGRLGFGADGKLYISTGETGDEALAQDLDSLGGKILRVNPDGSIPADNPFDDSPVWSYGHRNVQGLAWDGEGRLWASEFGSELWDEINLIEPGQNYGWPAAEGTGDLLDGMTDPFAVFSTDAASPSGLAFAAGSLWMAALQGETTWRVPVLSGPALGEPQAIRIESARTRTVVLAPDGRLWASTSSTDGRGTPLGGGDEIVAFTP